MRPDSFDQKLKGLTARQRECFQLIEQALQRPANEAVERALQLARVACLGEQMWKGVRP